MPKKEYTINIPSAYIILLWLFGFMFTFGLTITHEQPPMSVWEQIFYPMVGFVLWPSVLGLYIAKLLGTY